MKSRVAGAGSVGHHAPVVALGTQPEENGKLQCLICWRWYRQLGQHISVGHRVAVDDYRARFGLPASRGLHSSEILQARADRGRRQWHKDKQVRARLIPTRTTTAQRAALAAQRRKETLARPGVRTAATAAGHAVHQSWLATVDARLTAAATAAGFRDLATMLTATAALPAPEVARLLNISTRRVEAARRRLGPGVPGRDPQLCEECGKRWRGLSQHVRMAHGMGMDVYRQRHPLSAEVLERFVERRD